MLQSERGGARLIASSAIFRSVLRRAVARPSAAQDGVQVVDKHFDVLGSAPLGSEPGQFLCPLLPALRPFKLAGRICDLRRWFDSAARRTCALSPLFVSGDPGVRVPFTTPLLDWRFRRAFDVWRASPVCLARLIRCWEKPRK